MPRGNDSLLHLTPYFIATNTKAKLAHTGVDRMHCM